MKTTRLRFVLPASVFVAAVVLAHPLAAAQDSQPRAIELKDMLAWKSIRTNAISNNGQWFAYQLVPAEGDGEVVLRSTQTDKELRFPIGEQPRGESRPGATPPARAQSSLAFSEDARWLGFLVYPAQKDAEKLKKQKKPIQSRLALVNVSSGEKTEYDKVRSFSFSGENPGWVAFHRYSAETPGRGKPAGADLILQELATGNQINIGNVSEFVFDKQGEWLAWAIDAQEKSGNGVQIRNMKTGAVMPLDSDKAIYKRLTWTRKGDALAVLKGKEDKKYENELFSLVGFTKISDPEPVKVVYQPADDSGFPSEMTISPNRSPEWAEGLDGIYFGIHELKKKDEKEQKEGAPEPSGPSPSGETAKEPDENRPDLILWHWKDNRLQAQQWVEESRDKDFSYLCFFNSAEKKFIRLADEEVKQVNAAPDQRYAIGLDVREYELMGSLDGRRYQDVYVIDPKTGTRKLALKKCRWLFGSSPQGDKFVYYDDGQFFAYDMASGQARNITKDVATSFIDKEDDHNVVNPPIRPLGWAKDGKSVLLYDNRDVWNVPVVSGPAVNLTVNGKKDGIRYRRRYVLDPEEKGIDLSGNVYLDALAERSKKAGIARLDGGKPGAAMLLWDDALFSTLVKAKKADAFLYTMETFDRYPDYYVTDASLHSGKKITAANPQQKDFLWSAGQKLVDYTSDKGDKLQAALFLPAGYEAGKSYPMVVYIYEKLTSGLNRYYQPAASGFNKSVYTSNGYAVLMPDIVYRVNDPGMSAVWCVVPAVKAAVATGIADPKRVAIHGHSWGGYQTAFLVTQTDIFRAAIAGAPLTNMISMYSSVYWNTGSANQPIFESSQGRFTGGPWEVPEAYTRNSPVYYAQNIKTPLIILHNDKDGAVDWNQGVTYFNTIRRMRKPAVMLEYKGENHGLAKPANQKDYTVRMKEFLDHHLMGKPAPKWWLEGIPYLKLDEELRPRAEPKPPTTNP
jgi:dipeptidyl aminopeptidase/acylaminoacyl peptidase